MAKRREEELHEETKKQAHRRRRDEEANRKVMIGLAVVGVLLLLVILAGVIQELVIKPRQPIATINGQRIGLQDYQKQVKFSWYQQLQQGQAIDDPQSSGLQVLDQMIDLELLREQAAQRGIVVNEQEISELVEQSFGFYRQTPTPFPTSTPDPNASPTPEPAGTVAPTSTPAPTATPFTEEAFKAELKRTMDTITASTDMTEAEWRKLVETELLQQKLYEDVTKDIPTTGAQRTDPAHPDRDPHASAGRRADCNARCGRDASAHGCAWRDCNADIRANPCPAHGRRGPATGPRDQATAGRRRGLHHTGRRLLG